MQLSSNAAVVQAQAQAAASQDSTATPTFAALVRHPPTATPSLLQEAQERAQAGLQIVKDQADLVVQAASERVNTARAGKTLLDDGGEIAAQAVVAKKASIDASDIDGSIASRVEAAIVKLDDSVARLRIAEAARHTMEPSGVSFFNIAAEHEERLAALRQIAHMLETPASSAQMSLHEFDALAIVQAKAECSTLISKASAGLESVKQKTLASLTPSDNTASSTEDAVSKAPRDKTTCAPELVAAPVPAFAAPVPAPTLLQGLRQNAMLGLQNIHQAANDRMSTAKAGKKLLDEGGDAVAQLVVAKKAALEAADIDRNIAQRVRAAIFKFDDSVAKLMAIESDSSIMSYHDAIQLAEEHETRAALFRQIADMVKEPISSVTMSLAEWDALSLVKVKEGCGALQSRTNEGFEAVNGLAFSSCRGGVDSEIQRKIRRTVCA